MQRTKILNILPKSIGGRLTMSSIIEGLRQNGYFVEVFDDLYDTNFNFKNGYDLVFGYDFDAIRIKKQHEMSIPSINYFSDEIRSKTSGEGWDIYLDELSKNDNYTFYWDRELIKNEPFKNIFYLPHFINPEIYKDITAPTNDVMFAGRLDTDYRLNMITSLVEELPEINFEWYAINRHFEDALSRSQNKDLIKKIYKGFIDNEKDMAIAINKSKIVINMNSQGKSSLNYRTFQTVACKRLLISDYRSELDLFKNNLPYYKDKADLKEKIKFYLNNEKEYAKITEICQAICYKHHNSKDGTKFMLEKIQLTKD